MDDTRTHTTEKTEVILCQGCRGTGKYGGIINPICPYCLGSGRLVSRVVTTTEHRPYKEGEK
jgi:DnaJ-class molecular chaperone